MSILTVNIGNSRTTLGWFSAGKIQRTASGQRPQPRLLEAISRGRRPAGIGLCSVVPQANPEWDQLLAARWPNVPRLWINHRLDLGIRLALKKPEQTGHDRLADAVAGAELCGAPCIVCDFGTASTFNLVLPRRGFVGGVIAPGYGMWFEALSRAAQLPKLPAGGIQGIPVGRNTEEAMRLSASWGYRGLIKEILWELSRFCGHTPPKVCATGGFARSIVKDTGLNLPVIPHLTLYGIARIYERNRPS